MVGRSESSATHSVSVLSTVGVQSYSGTHARGVGSGAPNSTTVGSTWREMSVWGPGTGGAGGSHELGVFGTWSDTMPMSRLSAIHWYFLPIRSIHAGLDRPP